MPTLGIAREFLREFGKLQRSVQDRVYETFAKFEEATFAGIHLELIRNVRDSRLKSIRIDQFWRGVVLAPTSGDSYLLLRVLPHDEAYRWAQRKSASVNRATGSIEIRDVASIEDRMPRLEERAAATSERLLGAVSDADLRRLGIDDQVLAFARTLTDLEQLETARTMLPEPQYDALLGLALGMSPEDVWTEVADTVEPGEFDPDDVTAALARSTKQVVLVSGPGDLMEIFSYPFDLWRVYLHPVQHRVAYGSFSGPVRVTGGPGTGKTVAVLHRAKYLAERSTSDRSVLVTTFTKTLTSSLENQLHTLVEDDDVLRRIDVRHVDQVANQVVATEYGRISILSADEQRQTWRKVIGSTGVKFSDAFLAQEWREVVLANEVVDFDGYLAAPRRGRGRQLGQRQKEQIWTAIAAFLDELRRLDRWTYETVCVEAARLLADRTAKPYQHVVVDEGQDLGPWGWRLLRAAVAESDNDLFITADAHQRIYNHRVSLKQLGIKIAGRSARLTLNYRTTAEILGWSIGLLRGEEIDALNDDLDTLAGCRSDVHGDRPLLRPSMSAREEMQALVKDVRGWLADGIEPDQVGIAARTWSQAEAASSALTNAGLPATSIARSKPTAGRISVATMHAMKGLEFRAVAVIGLSKDSMPFPKAVTPASEDPIAHNLDLQQERCLLFVACTRAREKLRLSWQGTRSSFLPRTDG
ncbi:UvrD-helicase domain-containing protein [Amycolatopsis vancoresmycina]|uniref:DNA 3'-5' helicase n=1 Tax=Amycolatopsis vancoresmycina DSM 44592 TaxID=1292037 RepID=R1G8D1_9PSEU|nr:UvrD-helicase domain-containing protein [Amycolatopsis vancoresmycina]EOD67653.1 UvrD/REP helicase [Amycolatopsis vancoresmycina DSM 44592]